MVPLRPKEADRRFVCDQIYWLVEAPDELSAKSMRHQFAVLKKAWENLSEADKEQFPTPQHLRKRALIEAGFYTESAIEVGDQATAGRLAVSLRRRDTFAVIFVRDGYLFERVAESQSSMDRERFQKSKDAIFEIVANMIGVSVAELTRESERTT